MSIDKGRAAELDHMVRKMGVLISVFEVRSEPIGNSHFKMFRDLMDIYHAMCERQLRQNKDFIDEVGDMTEQERETLKAAFEKIFGKAPNAI